MEIAPGIHRIDASLGARVSSTYVVIGARASLLFDVGIRDTPSTVIRPYLVQNGFDPASLGWIAISHCDVDHFGGLADARASFPNARVLAHALDLAPIVNYDRYLSGRANSFVPGYGFDEDPAVLTWARSVTESGPVDLAVLGGEIIDLGGIEVELLHVPGHTRGHLALHLREQRTLVVSDAVLGSAVVNQDGTGAFPPTYRHVDDYLATIQRLDELAATTLLTAHYPTFTGPAVHEFFHRSHVFAVRLDERVRDALERSRGGLTLHALLRQLNDGSDEWPVEGTVGALAFPVVGHVERLVETGEAEVVAGADGSVPTIRATDLLVTAS